MHRLNWVTIVLIVLTGIFYSILLSNRFSLGRDREEKIAKQEKQIEDKTKEVEKIRTDIFGIPLRSGEEWEWNRMGLVAKSDKLDSLVPGKVWTICQPGSLNGAEGNSELELSFTVYPTEGGARTNDSAKVGEKDLVYIFDKGILFPNLSAPADSSAEPSEVAAEPARFLGIFTVSNIEGGGSVPAAESEGESAPAAGAPYTYTVRTIGVVPPEQRERIAESINANHAWIVYEGLLPIDSPTDISVWLKEYPESPFNKSLSDDERAFFQKTTYGTAADLEAFDAALAEAKDDRSLQSFADPPEGKRYPDRYDTKILREYFLRDKLFILNARGEGSKGDLDQVISDQLTMLGCTAVPGTEDWDADPDLIETFNGLDEDKRAEFEEKSAALLEVYKKIGSEGLTNIASLLPSAQNGFQSQSFFDQKREAVEKLRVMISQRDIVENRLNTANETVTQVEARIGQLIGENARLGRSIAEAQFEAADAAEARAASMAAQAMQ
ncbi:MAG: hypothetical protein J6S40_04850 [Thermoguttaceae bacterium]|nr:hypothetical protein [Thermoguttaceae bacterium]